MFNKPEISMSPWMACHKVALEASPSHPSVVVERNLHPFLALVVQTMREATIEHTYFAENENIKISYYYCYLIIKETNFCYEHFSKWASSSGS